MKRLLFTMLLALVACASWAYDIVQDGVYYNILSERKASTRTYYTLQVTSGDTPYSGSVSIPAGFTWGATRSYTVTSIGDSAFYKCSNLTSVTIADGPTTIGEGAFGWCSNLKTISIPKSIKSIKSDAFLLCSKLEGVYISSLSAWCSIDFENSIASPLYNDNLGLTDLYLNNVKVESLVIPSNVTSISAQAFSHSSITSVQIPENVTSIGAFAFYNCGNLTMVDIPNSLTTIGRGVFAGCSEIASITIPESVTSIGINAFAGCRNLKSINIPNSVTTIGNGAFEGCYKLEEIVISSLDAWCKMAFEDGTANPLNNNNAILYLGGNKATSLIIPSSVTSVPQYAFYGYKNLSSVTFTNSISKVGERAFGQCTNLSSVTFLGSVDEIAPLAFNTCTSLSSVTCMSTVVPKAGMAFHYSNYNHASLIVPKSAMDSYLKTSPWSEFGNYWSAGGGDSGTKGDVNNDGEVDAADITRLINIILKK